MVPEGAGRLTVSIINGSGDLDLYLTWVLQPPSGPSHVDDLDADSDVRFTGRTAGESITLTPNFSSPLVPDEWWVTVQNLNDSFTAFTVIATLEVEPAADPWKLSGNTLEIVAIDIQ